MRPRIRSRTCTCIGATLKSAGLTSHGDVRQHPHAARRSRQGRHRRRQCIAGGPPAARVRVARRDRRGRLRHRLPRLRPLAGARGGDQGIYAGALAGRSGEQQVSLLSAVALRDLCAGPELVRQRGQAAGALRPSVAAESASLLGRQRHRLHGDAAVPRQHAAPGAPRQWSGRPTSAGCCACSMRCSARSRCCTTRACTTATSRPTTS